MSSLATREDFTRKLRRILNDIRELKLRVSAVDTVEPWNDAVGLVNTGWATSGDSSNGLRLRYYRHAQRVWWGGTIEYVGGVGAEPTLPILLPPVGYRPDRLTNTDLAFDQDVSSGYVSGDWLPSGFGGAVLSLDEVPTLGDALILDDVSYRHA